MNIDLEIIENNLTIPTEVENPDTALNMEVENGEAHLEVSVKSTDETIDISTYELDEDINLEHEKVVVVEAEAGGYYTPKAEQINTETLRISFTPSKGSMLPIAPTDLTILKGESGEPGVAGSPGRDGISVTHKWNGTELTITSASGTSSSDLKGEKGDSGVSGNDGYTPVKGLDYFDGTDGKDGISASHSWNGTTLTITSASGTSSADLKGDKGDKGDTGEVDYSVLDGYVTKEVADSSFAPAGYGLGPSIPAVPSNLYDVVASGLYCFDPDTANIPSEFAYGVALVQRSTTVNGIDTYITLKSGSNIAQCYYSSWAKAWQPWEYINPPMSAGVEYRTTERWQGKPVYTKLISFGTPSNGLRKTITSENITVVRHTGLLGNCPIPYGAYGDQWYSINAIDRQNIYLYCSTSFATSSYPWVHQFWYIKN